jgi:Uncharacterized protein conserved in bacteria
MKPLLKYILPLFAALWLAGAPSLFAQSTDSDFSERLDAARKLYQNGMYYAAEQAFAELGRDIEDVNSIDNSEIEAFKVMCAIKLDRSNAEGLVKNFCDIYPTSPEIPRVRYTLGSHYFDKGEYKDALEVLGSLRKRDLFKDLHDEYEFKYAYSNMRMGNYKEASRGFKTIKESPRSQYTYPSIYYLGYVDYLQKDFRNAVPLFEEAARDNRFTLMSTYYAVESKFMLGDHKYVTSNGPAVYDKLEPDLQTNLARILSEAYYSQGNNSSAQKYLDLYKKSGASLSRKDHYFSGMLSYSMKDYAEAINSFGNVLGVEDSLSQNASYYSANSYLLTKNKHAAMDAFKAAADLDFDKVIKEDALFNYAKLCFDVNSDISKFSDYLTSYPKSGKDDIINGYMAASFLLGKDYRSAVDALQKIKKPTVENSSNLQKAAFFRAMELIDGKAYRSAIPLLQTSIDNDEHNSRLGELARYWLAECFFRDDRFQEASALNYSLTMSPSFKKSDEYSTAIYNLGYCYLKAGEFDKAGEAFARYVNIQPEDDPYAGDAKVRLADSYFMQKDYAQAASNYLSIADAYTASGDLYPLYQAAVSYGLAGASDEKINTLKKALKSRSAPLYAQSLFELGRTYEQKGRDSEASECFFTLLGMPTDSVFHAKSLLELAMINSNGGKYDKAIDYYKEIVESYPSTAECQDALSGMESLYQIMNRPGDYLSYLDERGLSSVKSDEEKEQMLFGAAERVYLAGKYSSAMSSLQSYLSAFPEGANSLKANYYLAESLRNTGRKDAACDAYLKVLRAGRSEYAEDAARKYGDICYSMGSYGRAVSGYETLVKMARSESARLEGYAGRMRAYFKNKQYDAALKDAQMVSNTSSAGSSLAREARFIMAKSYQVRGEREMAFALFEDLSADCSDAYGAESAYRLALDAYDSGDFAAVEEKVYAFADKGSSQLYWLAKSFLVLGDSFAERGDYEQARATYQSIVDGYQPSGSGDDVLEQARVRINRLSEMGK